MNTNTNTNESFTFSETMLHSFASEDLECNAAVIWTVCFMHFCYSFGSLSASAQKGTVQTMRENTGLVQHGENTIFICGWTVCPKQWQLYSAARAAAVLFQCYLNPTVWTLVPVWSCSDRKETSDFLFLSFTFFLLLFLVGDIFFQISQLIS